MAETAGVLARERSSHQKCLVNVTPMVRGRLVMLYGCRPHSGTEFGGSVPGWNVEHWAVRATSARSSKAFLTNSSRPQLSLSMPAEKSTMLNEGCTPNNSRSAV